MRPTGIAASAILLRTLNLLSLIFIRWNEPDTPVLAALVSLYVLFTAIVIQAYWKGENWARWLILIRSVWMLASFRFLELAGGFHRQQGIVERVLAVFLIVYLNTSGVRAWFTNDKR